MQKQTTAQHTAGKNDFFDRATDKRALALTESLRVVAATIFYTPSDSPLVLRESYGGRIDYVAEGFDFVVRFEKFLALLKTPAITPLEEKIRQQELDEIERELRQYLDMLVLTENKHFHFQTMNDRRKEDAIRMIALPNFRDFLSHFERDHGARLQEVHLIHKKADQPRELAEIFLKSVTDSDTEEPQQNGIIVTAPSFICKPA